MTLMRRTVPANSVPAAAVIRGGQALFGMIGRKEHVDGFLSGLFPLWRRGCKGWFLEKRLYAKHLFLALCLVH